MKHISFPVMVMMALVALVACGDDDPLVPMAERYESISVVVESYRSTLSDVYENNRGLYTEEEWSQLSLRYGYIVSSMSVVPYALGLCQTDGQSYCNDGIKDMDIAQFELNKMKPFLERAKDVEKNIGPAKEIP